MKSGDELLSGREKFRCNRKEWDTLKKGTL